MDAAAFTGMPPEAETASRAPDETPEERQRRLNRDYQRAHRAKAKAGGATPGGLASPPRQAPPAGLRVVAEGERAKARVEPKDEPRPISEAIRLQRMAPALLDLAAKQLDDGRLQDLCALRVPLDPEKPDVHTPLVPAFGASLDKVADLSGITVTALEAALLESATLGFVMWSVYKAMPPKPYNQADVKTE